MKLGSRRRVMDSTSMWCLVTMFIETGGGHSGDRHSYRANVSLSIPTSPSPGSTIYDGCNSWTGLVESRDLPDFSILYSFYDSWFWHVAEGGALASTVGAYTWCLARSSERPEKLTKELQHPDIMQSSMSRTNLELGMENFVYRIFSQYHSLWDWQVYFPGARWCHRQLFTMFHLSTLQDECRGVSGHFVNLWPRSASGSLHCP